MEAKIMANKRINLRAEFHAYKQEFDLLQKIPCTEEENIEYQKLLEKGGTLPENVYAYFYEKDVPSTTEFYTIRESDLTESEIREYLAYRQLSLIRTIKNCAVFFTVLTIIGILALVLISMVDF